MINLSPKRLSYVDLLQAFPPRPIKSDEELLATQNVIDALIDNAPLTPDEQDYLDLLGTLVYEYEQTKEPVPDIYGIELLQALMAEYDLQEKDLIPVLKTESMVVDILTGKSQLTVSQIQELAEFFHLSPAVFLPLPSQNS
ncbi:MAG TPA: transcriptional regulator [Nostocaceae cyanobacterium]|nr:transcriptional regulator [Nostocaceae cyanobacterium]